MNDLLADLGAPFDYTKIHWRVGSTKMKDGKKWGMPLAYIDARDVMERLDEVVGAENWQDRYDETSKRLICYLSVRTGGEWITKADGAGDTNMEGEKGGLSDAFKRAAVKWNIGRYLYNCENKLVELENGKYLPKSFGQAEILKRAANPFSSPQQRKKSIDYLRKGIAEVNGHMIRECVAELTTEQHQELWRQLVSNERSEIKRLMEETSEEAA